MKTSNLIWPVLFTALVILGLSAFGLFNYISAVLAAPRSVEVGGWHLIWWGIGQNALSLILTGAIVWAWWSSKWTWFHRLAAIVFGIYAAYAAYGIYSSFGAGPWWITALVFAWCAWLSFLVWRIATRLSAGRKSQ